MIASVARLQGPTAGTAKLSSSRRCLAMGGKQCKPHHGSKRGAPQVVRASLKAQELTEEGKAFYTAGNRMGAMRCFEEALEEGPTPEQRQAALYNIICCHASFGDVELAQITLRDAINAGLNFEAALEAAVANPNYVPFASSKQAKIQLKKFAETYAKSVAANARTKTAAPPVMGGKVIEKRSVQEILGTKDVSGMTSTELTGIDTSVGGIVARVLGLVVVLILSGVAAYFIGLDYVMNVPETDFGTDIMDTL
eukprot:CAMPEP_0117671922 /NCGR_PEP_ID=MMETSP0804-20121206/13617_1 /TAXON_ID=1074897 /ORGANISM="Tetraselmis astigmatica, Strain CCMP880" /LENGTH=252 /DNA_ID=CAMNT_0005480465 /DNA_START=58 /DNA_END=816 /DNA_ORIENTATION=+